ncbi:MAG: uracil-DNA glycosylase [Candidatus Babeliales bacterium]|jgi:uracil-DNA glycosylase
MTPRQEKFFKSLPASWQQPLKAVCQSPEIDKLITFLQEREAAGAVIYPPKQSIFAALQATPFDKVSVVIVGQDPYHGPGQAHGLSFSVPKGIVQPPSLRNIFKELKGDLGIATPFSGTLTSWAEQGVLLLNALLTVEENSPASHAGKGWEQFTDAIIAALIKRNQPTVFMLWGAYAQKKVAHVGLTVAPSIHLILKAAHPSPFSVTKFLGCKHFSQANTFLKEHHLEEIDWLIK